MKVYSAKSLFVELNKSYMKMLFHLNIGITLDIHMKCSRYANYKNYFEYPHSAVFYAHNPVTGLNYDIYSLRRTTLKTK